MESHRPRKKSQCYEKREEVDRCKYHFNANRKKCFLWPGRNYVRKALEAYFTVLIEAVWGKKRILEIYVNSIEWGDGIYGIEAASQEFFKSRHQISQNKKPPCLLRFCQILESGHRQNLLHISKRARSIQGRMNGVSIPK